MKSSGFTAEQFARGLLVKVKSKNQAQKKKHQGGAGKKAKKAKLALKKFGTKLKKHMKKLGGQAPKPPSAEQQAPKPPPPSGKPPVEKDCTGEVLKIGDQVQIVTDWSKTNCGKGGEVKGFGPDLVQILTLVGVKSAPPRVFAESAREGMGTASEDEDLAEADAWSSHAVAVGGVQGRVGGWKIAANSRAEFHAG